jgi:uncharacterized protein (TIGR00156 family)
LSRPRGLAFFYAEGDEMKSSSFLAMGAFVLFAVLPVHAQDDKPADGPSASGGFVDKGGFITVDEAKRLWGDALVQVQGNIVRRINCKKYLFRDASGVLVVKIDNHVWRGLTVGPDDTVVLLGKIDKDFPGLGAEIKVYSIEKP